MVWFQTILNPVGDIQMKFKQIIEAAVNLESLFILWLARVMEKCAYYELYDFHMPVNRKDYIFVSELRIPK